jgi:type IV secretory pathway VirB4 component
MGTPSFQTLSQETRFSGHWVVAQQGMGKTTLLINMIAADLQRDASIIVMDAKGDLTEAVRHLNLGSRLIILDPVEAPFALNPLDVPKTDTKRSVDQVEYIFGAMLGASVTPKQQALLRSLLRACIVGIPDPTLLTIQDLIISGPDKYRAFIREMPPDLQHLFDTSPNGEWKSYDAPRSELKWRLRLLLESELIQRIFMAPHTRFKIGEAMDAGNIIVIDNSQAKLHVDGSMFLGRYFIAQIWAAATARAAKPRDPKKPVFVYIDEADTVIDAKVAEIIDRCRSQNIGLILAHQRTKQIEDTNVLSALEN